MKKVVLIVASTVYILGLMLFSLWWKGSYSNFDKYLSEDKYSLVLFTTEEKSVKTIVDELYASGIYPKGMPKDAIIKKIEELNCTTLDAIFPPAYVVVPMPNERIKK